MKMLVIETSWYDANDGLFVCLGKAQHKSGKNKKEIKISWKSYAVFLFGEKYSKPWEQTMTRYFNSGTMSMARDIQPWDDLRSMM